MEKKDKGRWVRLSDVLAAQPVHPVVHETLQRECDRLINERDAALAKLAQPDRKALAEEAKRLANLVGWKVGALDELHAAIDRLAAQPVQEPTGDAPELLNALEEASGWVSEYVSQMRSYYISEDAQACLTRIREVIDRHRELLANIAAAPSAQPKGGE